MRNYGMCYTCANQGDRLTCWDCMWNPVVVTEEWLKEMERKQLLTPKKNPGKESLWKRIWTNRSRRLM